MIVSIVTKRLHYTPCSALHKKCTLFIVFYFLIQGKNVLFLTIQFIQCFFLTNTGQPTLHTQCYFLIIQVSLHFTLKCYFLIIQVSLHFTHSVIFSSYRSAYTSHSSVIFSSYRSAYTSHSVLFSHHTGQPTLHTHCYFLIIQVSLHVILSVIFSRVSLGSQTLPQKS